jgi:hypothetical protein
MESLFAPWAQRLCATVEKRVPRSYAVMMLVLLGLSFEKAGINHFGVPNTLYASVLLNKPNLW